MRLTRVSFVMVGGGGVFLQILSWLRVCSVMARGMFCHG